MTALLTLLFMTTPPADAELRKQANHAYRHEDYDVACKLFERISSRAPKEGAAWADLGLCLMKLGKTEGAIAANMRAADLEDRKARLHAYFNLSKLGVALALPQLAIEECRFTPECVPLAKNDCAKTLSACGRCEDESGTGVYVYVAHFVFKQGELALDVPAGRTYSESKCRPQDRCGWPPECETKTGAALKACQADQAKHEACLEQPCDSGSQADDEPDRCQYVFVDPCRGLIGRVCAGSASELVLAKP